MKMYITDGYVSNESKDNAVRRRTFVIRLDKMPGVGTTLAIRDEETSVEYTIPIDSLLQYARSSVHWEVTK